MNLTLSIIIPFVVFVIAILAGRVLSEVAYRQISSEEKGRLYDLFMVNRIVNYIISTILGLVVLIPIIFEGISSLFFFIPWLILYSLFYICMNIWSFLKLQKNKYPKKFILLHSIASFINFLGLVVFLGSMLITNIRL